MDSAALATGEDAALLAFAFALALFLAAARIRFIRVALMGATRRADNTLRCLRCKSSLKVSNLQY